MNRYLLAWLVIVLSASTSHSGNVESFNSRLFDLLFFTRPYERSAINGGAWQGERATSSATLHNPASLGFVKNPELLTFFTYNYLNGETYGLKQVISSGYGDYKVNRRAYEKPLAQVINTGAYQALALGDIPGMFGFGADYIGSQFSENDVTKIEEYGFRVGVSYGVKLTDTLAVGYGLTLLRDNWQWGVTWADYSGGSEEPERVNYYVKSAALSFRHRLGVRGTAAEVFRYGIEGEFGHGDTNSTWNGVNNGGGNGMLHYGMRAGLGYDVFDKMTMNLDLQWYRTQVEFGYHSPGITKNNLAQWDASVFRTMVGVDYSLFDWLSLIGGYRYNQFYIQDLCGKNADNTYDTFSAGITLKPHDRFTVMWSFDYSNVAPSGETMNMLSVQTTF